MARRRERTTDQFFIELHRERIFDASPFSFSLSLCLSIYFHVNKYIFIEFDTFHLISIETLISMKHYAANRVTTICAIEIRAVNFPAVSRDGIRSIAEFHSRSMKI